LCTYLDPNPGIKNYRQEEIPLLKWPSPLGLQFSFWGLNREFFTFLVGSDSGRKPGSGSGQGIHDPRLLLKPDYRGGSESATLYVHDIRNLFRHRIINCVKDYTCDECLAATGRMEPVKNPP
jgi:hypothetical protein